MVSHKTKSKIAIVFCSVFLIAAGIMGYGLWTMDNAGNPSPDPNNKAIKLDPYGFPEVDWEYWKSVNEDVIGWITVPGTNIDSPIVQAHEDDPEYYLSHDAFKNYNVYGCPYLDSKCESQKFNSQNSVIFGHHMNNGTVFSAFADFTSKEFAQTHDKILIQTPTEKEILSVKFSEIIDASNNSSKKIEFANQLSFEKWYSEQLENASMVLSPTIPQKTYTIVTCSYNRFQNERTLVFASEK